MTTTHIDGASARVTSRHVNQTHDRQAAGQPTDWRVTHNHGHCVGRDLVQALNNNRHSANRFRSGALYDNASIGQQDTRQSGKMTDFLDRDRLVSALEAPPRDDRTSDGSQVC